MLAAKKRTVSLVLSIRQIVWFHSCVPYIESQHVRVEKLGHWWATLSNGYRCNRYTGIVDGGKFSSPGTIYLSQESYDKEAVLLGMWIKLQRDIATKPILVEDLSRRKIIEVRRLLALDN